MIIQGTVRYIELSGGFWGIEADSGHKYAPVDDLPKPIQEEGLRIKAHLTPAQVFSIMMWGEPVQVKSIEKL